MFQGFPQDTVDFMWGIRLNNERSWFTEHKEQYENSLNRPMKALAHDVYQGFAAAHSELDLYCKVSRIYRDARRLFGRGPYKDHLWFCIRRPDQEVGSSPVFWFELTPENWSYGLGFYDAPPLYMAKLRARIDHAPRPLERLTRALNRQDEFVLEITAYKRPKGGVGALLDPWYNAKSFSLCHEEGHSAVLHSGELTARVLAGYEFLLPFYKYFLSVDGDADPREA